MWFCRTCGVSRAIPLDRRREEDIHPRALYAWAYLKHKVACRNEMLSCACPNLGVLSAGRGSLDVEVPPDCDGLISAWRDPSGVVPILGLDVDGVLDNCARRFAVRDQPRERNFVYAFGQTVDPKTIARLDAVVRETGALVLLMSTWRKFLVGGSEGHPDDDGALGTCHARVGDIPLRAQKAFYLTGFRGIIYDTTPIVHDVDYTARNQEVRQWLRSADLGPRVRLVMVDDSYGDGDLLPHLIQTTHRDGWTDETTSQVMAAFANPEFDLDPRT